MRNVIVCFDSTMPRTGAHDATNAEVLFRLLDASDDADQVTWYDAGEAALNSPQLFNPAARRWRQNTVAAARRAIVDAYHFIAENWQPQDRIFLLGAGRGAYCARSLARMLGVVGLMTDADDHFVEYALGAYALPTHSRTREDWQQVHRLACIIQGRSDIAVPVHFLGLWDTVRVPGTPALSEDDYLDNVLAGRHAVAIDGGAGPFAECRIGTNDAIEEVWFRGMHCDIVGGRNAYWPLADISLDWMLDGVLAAGASIGETGQRIPAPTELDALAEGVRSLRFRTAPEGALVHASVAVYVHAHPSYWQRLPARFQWCDLDWAARAERLPAKPPALEEPAAAEDSDELTAVAS